MTEIPSTSDLQTANRICDRILAHSGASVRRILMYGSRATGRAGLSSDFDMLVVLQEPVPDWLRTTLSVAKLFDNFAHPVDVQVFGESEYEESKPVAGTLAYAAERHGVVLHVSSELIEEHRFLRTRQLST
jgi:predicted nucleotidyltransferase